MLEHFWFSVMQGKAHYVPAREGKPNKAKHASTFTHQGLKHEWCAWHVVCTVSFGMNEGKKSQARNY